MKTIAVLVVLFVVANVYAQDWRDTLELARTAYKSKDFDKALGYYERAQNTAPDGVDLSDEMGQSAYKAKRYDVAEKIYQQNQANKNSSKAQADNYHNLGNSRMRQKNYEGAVDAYKDALRRNPKDEKTRYNLSEAIRQIKKKECEQEKNQQQNGNNGNQNQQQSQNGQQPQQQQGNGSQGNNQQNQNGQQSQGKQGQQQKNGQGGGNSSQPKDGKGKLSNKTADRMLDDLMKREAETQRRMAGYSAGSGRSKSGKDW
ncbi:tetratricopeptide repeat protein [Crocinitomicaceae bacterium]|nr:tetratricopeptide repeat protein [Crocinitomicaceae bacterium]